MIWDFVKDLPSMVWNFFKGAFDTVLEVLKNILNFFLKFFDILLEFIIRIFVPEDNYFVNKFDELKNLVNNKFNVDLSIFESLGSAAKGSVNNTYYSFNIMGSNVNLDISFITKIQSVTTSLCSGLVGLFLAWFNYKNVLYLIRGASPVESNNSK